MNVNSLNQYELITMFNILDGRAETLSKFIQSEDYQAKHGDMADAVRTADARYLADICALQAKINAAI
jgi:hypothetical protein